MASPQPLVCTSLHVWLTLLFDPTRTLTWCPAPARFTALPADTWNIFTNISTEPRSSAAGTGSGSGYQPGGYRHLFWHAKSLEGRAPEIFHGTAGSSRVGGPVLRSTKGSIREKVDTGAFFQCQSRCTCGHGMFKRSSAGYGCISERIRKRNYSSDRYPEY